MGTLHSLQCTAIDTVGARYIVPLEVKQRHTNSAQAEAHAIDYRVGRPLLASAAPELAAAAAAFIGALSL
jgi:hypothetical protein